MFPENLTLASLQRQSFILDLSADSVLIHDLDGNIIFANKSAYESRGYTREEMIGMKLSKIIIPEQNMLFSHRISELLKTGELRFESTHMRKDRSVFSTETQVKLIVIEGRKYCCSVIRDITERKRSEIELQISKSLLSSAFNKSPLLMTISDMTTGKYLDVNDSFSTVSGFSREDAVGKTAVELGWISGLEHARLMHGLKQNGRVIGLELSLRSKYQTRVICRFAGEIIKTTEGDRLFSTAEDITAQKREENRIKTILRMAMDGFYLVDMEGRILETNDSYCSMIGYSNEELLKMSVKDVEVLDTQELIEKRLQLILGIGYARFETKHKRKDGRVIDIEASVNYLSEKPAKFFCFMRDITDRKRAEEALLYFQMAVGSSTDAIGMSTPAGRHYYQNEAYTKLFGLSVSEVDGGSGPPATVYADEKVGRKVFDIIMKGGSFVGEVKMLDKERKERDIYLRAYSINNKEGKVVGLVGIHNDITERKKTEEMIKQNEIFIRSVLESVDEGIVVVGRDYRIITANKAFCDAAGTTMENAIGRYCYEVFHRSMTPCFEAGNQCAVKRTFETGEQSTFLHTHHDETGNPLYIDTKSYAMRDSAGNVTSAIEVSVDITEKKKLEDQYRQAQKMEAIGQLAGGVAHDFNNILSAIVGYVHLSLMKLQDDDPVRHYIDQILQSSERAAALTQSLLAFSRKQPVKIGLHELNVVIRNFEKFLHRLLREDIEMQIRYSAEQPMIMADRGQVEQVIMNLVTNARDAMPDKGKLTIDTRVSAIDEAFIRAHGYGKVGEYAMLSVSDTGLGMSEETKKRIFEPFFTTKEMGKGTGLGLATVYGIVKAHNGFVNVYSELGNGSVFHVYFPLARTTNAVPEPAEQYAVPLKDGSETILLAEDDVYLRNLTSVVLRDMGYTVIEAEDGNSTVARFNENRAAINLLILDGIMPKMNGLEAYQAISALNPNIPCIFMSGYSGDVFAQKGIPIGTEFLPKPLNPSDLLNKVREMLDKD